MPEGESVEGTGSSSGTSKLRCFPYPLSVGTKETIAAGSFAVVPSSFSSWCRTVVPPSVIVSGEEAMPSSLDTRSVPLTAGVQSATMYLKSEAGGKTIVKEEKGR